MNQITPSRSFDGQRHPVTQDRPRLFGSREQLRELTRSHAEPYQRMLHNARHPANDSHYETLAQLIGLSIAHVLDPNPAEARKAVDVVLKKFVDQPLQIGHMTFAHSMAHSAIVYDHCHELWTNDERKRFQQYVHATIAANVDSEISVFHNGWWGYKHWGYGLAAYALMHDDPEAPRILSNLEDEYLKLGAPGLQMAGEGGGWAEGYYLNYWLQEWLWMCEVARTCAGVDYYAAAPEFYSQAAIALMFSHFPPIYPPSPAPAFDPKTPGIVSDGVSRRPMPMGDGHGKYVKHERDKILMSRRILASYYRSDPSHQVVHAYNLQTPRVAIPCNAYMDFLFDDRSIKAGNLDAFKLSHASPGPGFAFARSSWKEDATAFFFRSGRRFTSHQHMDSGHFMIFKNEELLGDGGHYDTFGGPNADHAVNYYIRTIAHNSILIHDPAETWPQPSETTKGMRAGPISYNEGGQAWPWMAPGLGHNGGVPNVAAFRKFHELFDVAQLTAFKDFGPFLYTAGDFTKSYSAKKAKCVTRQIVYLRPGTFVLFDRVESTNAAFRKSFVLQPMKIPQQQGSHWVVAHGRGRLFIQTLSPAQPVVQLYHGDKLYEYGGRNFLPLKLMDAAPECRMEISPAAAATMDYFVHVLTTGDDQSNAPAPATLERDAKHCIVRVGQASVRFELARCAGSVTLGKQTHELAPGGAEPSFV